MEGAFEGKVRVDKIMKWHNDYELSSLEAEPAQIRSTEQVLHVITLSRL